jgi:hypothetical protein
LQVIAIIGERSRKAQPTPVARLVAPGPSVAMQEPGRAGHAAADVGREAGRALVRGEHELDAALAHRLHQRQHVAARNAEAAADAVAFSVATIRSALFMGVLLVMGRLSEDFGHLSTRFALDRGCRCAYKVAQVNGEWLGKCEILLRDWYR